jgi:hypothetical protein
MIKLDEKYTFVDVRFKLIRHTEDIDAIISTLVLNGYTVYSDVEGDMITLYVTVEREDLFDSADGMKWEQPIRKRANVNSKMGAMISYGFAPNAVR